MSGNSAPSVPTDSAIEIGVSWRRCLCGLAFATALTLILAVLLLEYDRGQDQFASIGFACLMVIYALSAITSVWYLLWAPRAIITVSPSGIRDVRISEDVIPWQAIERITTAPSDKWRRSVVLVLEREFARTAKLKFWARLAGAFDRSLGIDGIVVSHHLLDVAADDLLKLLKNRYPQSPGLNATSAAQRVPGREPVPTTIVLPTRSRIERRGFHETKK